MVLEPAAKVAAAITRATRREISCDASVAVVSERLSPSPCTVFKVVGGCASWVDTGQKPVADAMSRERSTTNFISECSLQNQDYVGWMNAPKIGNIGAFMSQNKHHGSDTHFGLTLLASECIRERIF